MNPNSKSIPIPRTAPAKASTPTRPAPFPGPSVAAPADPFQSPPPPNPARPASNPAPVGHEKMWSYQRALVVQEATAQFCARFLGSDAARQTRMTQAAESTLERIAEASRAKRESKESAIELLQSARKIQNELLEDYREFMSSRQIEEWAPEHPYAQRLRQLNRTPGANYDTFKSGLENPDPAISANVIAGLIKVTRSLLYRQIRWIEEDLKGGDEGRPPASAPAAGGF